jgi:acylphosphatase
MSQKTVRAVVSGQVQQVGFRQGCRQKARSLGLVGWVRNLSDGRVEVLAQGDSEQLDRLVSWLWTGSAGAGVTGVESEPVSGDQTLRDFFIHAGPSKSS